MKKLAIILALSATFAQAGEKNLFNGKDFTGWKGNPDSGASRTARITGQTTAGRCQSRKTPSSSGKAKSATSSLTFKYKITDDGRQRRLRQLRHPVSQQAGEARSIPWSPAIRRTSRPARPTAASSTRKKAAASSPSAARKSSSTQGDDAKKPKIEVTGRSANPRKSRRDQDRGLERIQDHRQGQPPPALHQRQADRRRHRRDRRSREDGHPRPPNPRRSSDDGPVQGHRA